MNHNLLARLARCVPVAVLSLLAVTGAYAQTVPHAVGEVEVGLREGAIRGDVCISGFPPGDTLHLVMNAVLTLQTVAGSPPVILHEETEPGEATRIFALARPPLAEPGPICFAYQGFETVYDVAAGDYRAEDASSHIAFNGFSLRARGPSRWLPTPFDPTIGLPAELFTFDLTIRCGECRTLYMNGEQPHTGPVATFRAATPREPYLVAGALAVARIDDSWVVGPVDPMEAAALLDSLQIIQTFYSAYLDVPFGSSVDLVFLTPVREPRRGRLWGFFSDPALTFIGMDAGELLHSLNNDSERARNSVRSFLAHELAHRYFGWGFGADSPQRDLFGEPFAAFLELQAIRHFIGEAAFRAAVDRLADEVERAPELPALDIAGPDAFDIAAYRYAYLPLLLLSLEHEIGDVAIKGLLRSLLAADPTQRATADFDFIFSTAAHLTTPDVLAEWIAECVSPEGLLSECAPRMGR